ncbi:MAG: MerR family transcriptional regulator [Lachnospiraceae bacterium]|nr:MerR family transcriptional regulator [Lachnospiraceae bacterium]
MKTIKEVSAISGLSIRTLRYYDEIGLLKPARLTEAGYRLYDDRALEKLQEILFFRELEIPLSDIKKIMENPSLDKEQILRAQKSMLEKKRNRLNSIIELITDRMKGVNTMSFSEFNQNDVTIIIEKMKKALPEEEFDRFMKEYGGGSVEAYQERLERGLNEENNKASLLKWYGSKEKVIEAYTPIQNMEELRKAFDALLREFAARIGCGGDDREQEMVEELADLYKRMLNMDNARNYLLDLAEEYLRNGKIAEVQDEQYGAGTTRYMAEAIRRYYGV